jgi:hypothetical protein
MLAVMESIKLEKIKKNPSIRPLDLKMKDETRLKDLKSSRSMQTKSSKKELAVDSSLKVVHLMADSEKAFVIKFTPIKLKLQCERKSQQILIIRSVMTKLRPKCSKERPIEGIEVLIETKATMIRLEVVVIANADLVPKPKYSFGFFNSFQ